MLCFSVNVWTVIPCYIFHNAIYCSFIFFRSECTRFTGTSHQSEVKKTQKNWHFWIYYSKRKVITNLCLFDLLGIFIPALAIYFMRFMWYIWFHEFHWSKDKFYLQKIICKNFVLQVTTKIINKITTNIVIISSEKRSKY